MIGGCLVCARLVLYLLVVDWWLFGIYLRFACLCGRTTLRAVGLGCLVWWVVLLDFTCCAIAVVWWW